MVRRTALVIGIRKAHKGHLIIPICVGQTLQCWDPAECATESIADSLSLIRNKEEHLVLLDGPSQRPAKHVAMERRSAAEERIGCQKGGLRVESIVLEVFVNQIGRRRVGKEG